MKHITTVMLGLIIVAGAGQARAGEGAEGTLARASTPGRTRPRG